MNIAREIEDTPGDVNSRNTTKQSKFSPSDDLALMGKDTKGSHDYSNGRPNGHSNDHPNGYAPPNGNARPPSCDPTLYGPILE